MIRFIHILFTIGMLSTIAAPGAPSWSLDLQRCENRVEVRAMGLPDVMHIMGNSKPLPTPALTGNLEMANQKISGTAEFVLESIDTGFAGRDRHIREHCLETGKWPRAVLTVEKMDLPIQMTEPTLSLKAVPFEGTLLLHGVKKPVSGITRVQKRNDEVQMVFDFDVRLPDHEVPTPKFFGTGVAQTIHVSVLIKGDIKSGEAKKGGASH